MTINSFNEGPTMSATTTNPPVPGNSRRDFLKRAGAAAVATTFMVVAGFEVDAAAKTEGAATDTAADLQAFRIDHPDGLRVSLTSGRWFNVDVTTADGTTIEQHRSITAAKLMRIQSDHFAVIPIAPGT